MLPGPGSPSSDGEHRELIANNLHSCSNLFGEHDVSTIYNSIEIDLNLTVTLYLLSILCQVHLHAESSKASQP